MSSLVISLIKGRRLSKIWDTISMNTLVITENFMDKELFPKTNSYAPDIATGGGLAVIGMILLAASHGMVIDITGGIISALGISLAGFTLLFSRKKAINAFDEEINKGRSRFKEIMEQKLKAYISNIKNRLDNNFAPFRPSLKQGKRGTQ